MSNIRVRAIFRGLLLGACIAGLSGCSRSYLLSQARSAIQAGYTAADAARTRKDMTAAFASYAPDFVLVSRNGIQSGLDKDRKDLSDLLSSSVQSATFTTTIQGVTLYDAAGDQVVATCARHRSLMFTQPLTHENGDLISDQVVRDYWMRGQNGWRIKREEVLSQTGSLQRLPPTKK